MSFVGTDVFLRDVLEEHYETLDFLWTQRRDSLHSADITHRDLVDRDERIAAHSDGLLLAGPDGIEIIAPGLASDEGSFSLASGFVLLAARSAPAAKTVISVFQDASPKARDGLGLALCYGPVQHTEAELQTVVAQASPPVAAAAAEVLAFHGQLADPGGWLATFAEDPNPTVRARAWRITALAAGAGAARLPLLERPARLQRAVADLDPAVRAQAFEAAVWSRQSWVLDECRRLAVGPPASPGTMESIAWLAILGTADDLELMRAIGGDPAHGPARFEWLASFGHPTVLPLIIAGFDPARPVDAAAAGLAFRRMTGLDVGSGNRVTVPPADGASPDAFDEEFRDEVELPDADLARAALDRVKDKLSGRARIARGFDVGPAAKADVLGQLDLRSRREAALRFAWARKPLASPADLERFPTR